MLGHLVVFALRILNFQISKLRHDSVLDIKHDLLFFLFLLRFTLLKLLQEVARTIDLNRRRTVSAYLFTFPPLHLLLLWSIFHIFHSRACQEIIDCVHAHGFLELLVAGRSDQVYHGVHLLGFFIFPNDQMEAFVAAVKAMLDFDLESLLWIVLADVHAPVAFHR